MIDFSVTSPWNGWLTWYCRTWGLFQDGRLQGLGCGSGMEGLPSTDESKSDLQHSAQPVWHNEALSQDNNKTKNLYLKTNKSRDFFWDRVSLYSSGWNSLCRPGWPWTQKSTSQVLGLKTCATTAWQYMKFLWSKSKRREGREKEQVSVTIYLLTFSVIMI